MKDLARDFKRFAILRFLQQVPAVVNKTMKIAFMTLKFKCITFAMNMGYAYQKSAIAWVQLHLAFFFSFFAHVCSQHLIGLKPGPDKLESMDDDDKLVLLLGPEALSNFKRPRKLHFLLHPSMP